MLRLRHAKSRGHAAIGRGKKLGLRKDKVYNTVEIVKGSRNLQSMSVYRPRNCTILIHGSRNGFLSGTINLLNGSFSGLRNYQKLTISWAIDHQNGPDIFWS